MPRFIVQFTHGTSASTREVEAENVSLCQRDVEKVLMANEADSAVIYEPAVMLKAQRSVEVTAMRPKPLIPSNPTPP